MYPELFVTHTCLEIPINYAFLRVGYLDNFSRWRCSNGCGRSYKYKGDLSIHLRDECGVQPKYKCGICFKAFARKGTLKTHSLLVHNLTPKNF